jgi:phosphate-selective porin OprO and OprP
MRRRILAILTVLIVIGRGAAQSAAEPGSSAPPQLPAVVPALPAHPEAASTDPPASKAIELPAISAASTPIRFDATWDNGLFLKSTDDQFRFHAGGIGQIDSVWLIGPQGNFVAPGGSTSGVGNAAATQLRRAILQVDGTVYGQFDFMIQYDFANASNDNSGLQPASFSDLTSSPAPQNIWMQVRDVPYFGIVRVGSQKMPIGMDNNTGSAFLPFMERSDNYDAFYGTFNNGFALGITARDWSESERLTWQYGIYRPATNVFGVALNKYSVGGRMTALPVYEDDGEELIHVGLGTFSGELVENQLRDRARTLLRNGPGFAVPILVDTGEIPGSRQYTIGPEFAAVYGPLSVQAEWAGQWLTDADPNNQQQGTVFYHGGYVEALYFLTGEHELYDKHEGVFGRVIPRSNFHTTAGDCCRGYGAWQVGVRFSYLDLNDKTIQGGQVYDWTLGLNWYLNPNMKVQLNYIAEHRDMETAGVNGWINGVGMRASYDF